ncbi:MAG TPA: saccharopine dehydrogenase C-terminal domain-containing protein [Saprospiraceae bacterium]|nr:saccharopine dehydrogenase C-terminal domain-containing protein [Saprospiraceae bacterium]
MQKLLIIGAGRSATTLISYLASSAQKNGWTVTVADFNEELLERRKSAYENIQTATFDIFDANQRRSLIAQQDLVISMLPASMHELPAKDCLELEKHFLNASYVSKSLEDIYTKGRAKELVFMGELGLDPGLDHISAMHMFDGIRKKKGEVISFRSFAGGLVADESDNNKWGYKFSWNPRNVVLAGKGTAQFKANGRSYFTPYFELFKKAYQVEVPHVGHFDWYPNRDSSRYIDLYDLQDCPTVIRGTLRRPGFCRAWHALIALGLTDDKSDLTDIQELAYEDLLRGIVKASREEDLLLKLSKFLDIAPNDAVIEKLIDCGLLSTEYIPLTEGSMADILEDLLMRKWNLQENDKDLIVMYHEIIYRKNKKLHQLDSVLSLKGMDKENTAMSRLVGLPLAIMAELVMSEKITHTDKSIPIEGKVYRPILSRLKTKGVVFNESHLAL